MPSKRYQTLKFVADIDIEKEKEIDFVIEIAPDIDTVPGRDKETVSDSAFFASRFFLRHSLLRSLSSLFCVAK